MAILDSAMCAKDSITAREQRATRYQLTFEVGIFMKQVLGIATSLTPKLLQAICQLPSPYGVGVCSTQRKCL